MVNQEVKSLVMDNKNLKQRHLDAEEELQLAYKRIKELEDENSDLKADLEDAVHNQKKAQEEANSARAAIKENPVSAPAPITPTSSTHHDTQHSEREAENDSKEDDDWNRDRQQARDSTLVNPNSVVHQISLSSFRNAVDDLLSAGR